MTNQADMKWDTVEGVETMASGTLLMDDGTNMVNVAIVSTSMGEVVAQALRIEVVLTALGYSRHDPSMVVGGGVT